MGQHACNVRVLHTTIARYYHGASSLSECFVYVGHVQLVELEVS